MGAIRMLAMMGGGGDFIKSLAPVFYIKDLTQIVGGYFVDSSGNNKQIQAATTTVANDSLIMPANDAQIIAAVTAAGCYSQYYVDNATPKKVLLSNVSPCYKDYGYYGYIDKKNFFFCSTAQTSNRTKILDLLKLHIVAFDSVQTATPSQASVTLQCAVGKLAYVDYGNWGNQAIQKVNATETDHTLGSTGYAANTTYKIQLFTPKTDNGFRKVSIISQVNFSSINSSHFVGMPLTFWNLTSSGADHTINSSHFVGMPLTNWSLVSSGTNHTINSSHFVGMPLTFWDLNNLSTNHTINSSHFVGMLLTNWRLTSSGTNHTINSSHFVGMPLIYWNLSNAGTNHSGTIGAFRSEISTLQLNTSGTGIDITTSLNAWANTVITIQSGYSETSVQNFIINWSTIAGIGTKTINLMGTNAPVHVNAVDNPTLYNAVQLLISKGKTILYNEY